MVLRIRKCYTRVWWINININ